MTEKRFEYVKPVVAFGKSGIIDNLKRNTFDFTEDNVIDSLNELNDENKELRMVIDGLKQQNQKLKGRLNDLGVEYYD